MVRFLCQNSVIEMENKLYLIISDEDDTQQVKLRKLTQEQKLKIQSQDNTICVIENKKIKEAIMEYDRLFENVFQTT